MPRMPEPVSDEVIREVAEEVVAAEDARLRQARAAIARVKALHVRSEKPRITHHLCSHHAALDYLDRVGVGACPDCTAAEAHVCQHCRHECPDDDGWPCATIRALEGEQ